MAVNIESEILYQRRQSEKLSRILEKSDKKINKKNYEESPSQAMKKIGLSIQSMASSFSAMSLSSIKTTENIAEKVTKEIVGSKERLAFSTIGQINPILAALTSKFLESQTFQSIVGKTKNVYENTKEKIRNRFSKEKIPKMKAGGTVGKNGLYNLHAGEVVVPYKETKKLFKKEKVYSELLKNSKKSNDTLFKIYENVSNVRQTISGDLKHISKTSMVDSLGFLGEDMKKTIEEFSRISKLVMTPINFLYKPRGGYQKYLPKEENVLINISKTLQVMFTFFAERLDSLRQFSRETALATRSMLQFQTGTILPPLKDDVEKPWTVIGQFRRIARSWKKTKKKSTGIISFFKNIITKPFRLYKELKISEQEVPKDITKKNSFFGKARKNPYSAENLRDYFTKSKQKNRIGFTSNFEISLNKIISRIDDIIKLMKRTSKSSTKRTFRTIRSNKKIKDEIKKSSIKNTKSLNKIKNVSQKVVEETKKAPTKSKLLLTKIKDKLSKISEKSNFLKKISRNTKDTNKKVGGLAKKIGVKFKDLLLSVGGFLIRMFSPKSLFFGALASFIGYQVTKLFKGSFFKKLLVGVVSGGLASVVTALGLKNIIRTGLGLAGKGASISGKAPVASLVGVSSVIGGIQGYRKSQKRFGEPLGQKLGVGEKLGLAAGTALKYGTFGLIDIPTWKTKDTIKRAKKARENLQKSNLMFLSQVRNKMSLNAYTLLASVDSYKTGEVFGNMVHDMILVRDNKIHKWVTRNEYLKTLPTLKERSQFEVKLLKRKTSDFKKYITNRNSYKYVSEKAKKLYYNVTKSRMSYAVQMLVKGAKDSRIFSTLVNSGLIKWIKNKWITQEEFLRMSTKTSGALLEKRLGELNRRTIQTQRAFELIDRQGFTRLGDNEFLRYLKGTISEKTKRLILSNEPGSISDKFRNYVLNGKIVRLHGKWLTTQEFLSKDLNLDKSNQKLVKVITESNKSTLQILKEQANKNKNLQKSLNESSIKRIKKLTSNEAFKIISESGLDNISEKFNRLSMTDQIIKVNGKWKTKSEIIEQGKTKFLGGNNYLELLTSPSVSMIPSGVKFTKNDLARMDLKKVELQNKIMKNFADSIKKPIEKQTRSNTNLANNLSTMTQVIINNNNVSNSNTSGTNNNQNIIDPNVQNVTSGLVP